MPATHGNGSPNQQLYSLFPKKKKGSKKTDHLGDEVSLLVYIKFDIDFLQEKRSSFSQKRGEGGMADKVSDWRAAPRPDPGQPQIREGAKTKAKNFKAWEGCSNSSAITAGSSSEVKVNRESGGASARPSMSFAEMAKKGSGGRNAIEKSRRNEGEVKSSIGDSRQTGPCLSQVHLLKPIQEFLGKKL